MHCQKRDFQYTTVEIERPNVEDTNNKILKYKIYVHIFIEIEITTENKKNNIKFM